MYRYAGLSGEEVGRSEWDRVKLKSFYPSEGPFMGVSYNLLPLVFILLGLFLSLYWTTCHPCSLSFQKQRTKTSVQGFHGWWKEKKGTESYASFRGNVVERAGASSLSLSPSGLPGLLTIQCCPPSLIACSEEFHSFSHSVVYIIQGKIRGCIVCWLCRRFCLS